MDAAAIKSRPENRFSFSTSPQKERRTDGCSFPSRGWLGLELLELALELFEGLFFDAGYVGAGDTQDFAHFPLG